LAAARRATIQGGKTTFLGSEHDAFAAHLYRSRREYRLGSYRISDLLSQLKARADRQEDGHYHVKLPNILLKTAQKSAFVTHHQHIDAVIHKMLRLGEFRDRYTDKNASIRTGPSSQPVTKDIASYMRVKGNKYAKVIQLQYYLNEIKKEVGLFLTSHRGYLLSVQKLSCRSAMTCCLLEMLEMHPTYSGSLIYSATSSYIFASTSALSCMLT
jgi:hypothetical protein